LDGPHFFNVPDLFLKSFKLGKKGVIFAKSLLKPFKGKFRVKPYLT